MIGILRGTRTLANTFLGLVLAHFMYIGSMQAQCSVTPSVKAPTGPCSCDGSVSFQVTAPIGGSLNLSGSNHYNQTQSVAAGTSTITFNNLCGATYNWVLFTSDCSIITGVFVFPDGIGGPTPVATISGNTNPCLNSTISLIGGPAAVNPPGQGLTYLWTTPAAGSFTTKDISLPATLANQGLYTLQVCNRTNQAACCDSISVTITIDQLAITQIATTPSCINQANGTITITISGGTAPFTYSYDSHTATSSSSSFTFTNVAAGTYMVTVTDANGCVVSGSAPVEEAANPGVSISATSLDICGASLPLLTAIGSGGSGSYTYLWTLPGPSTSSANPLTATVPGAYSVIATDTVSGCSSLPASIVINETLTAGIMPASPSFCAGSSTVLTAVATLGGGGTLTYQWYLNTLSNPILGAINSTLTVTQAGTYFVVITQVGEPGCTGTAMVTVVENEPPTVTIGIVTSSKCGPIELEAVVEQGTGTSITSYQWFLNGVAIPGAISSTFLATQSGMYTVTATDNNGCTSVQSPEVTLTITTCLVISQCCTVSSDNYATITVTLANTGTLPIAGPLQVIEKLPCCLEFIKGIGAGWAFASSGNTVTATYANDLEAGQVIRFSLQVKSHCKPHETVKTSATVVGVPEIGANCCLRF